ncbi:14180_t:CDS:1 [Acaulospora colombiana]|uniref:14180_t:CDS:1 n=1 Tax=Acaulospora colombiana TaxID=27376 RepID=A0ACA9QMF3_9GLOM|nr:14180_t:CDS:1 [Acaulospora colombiana]
MKFCAAYTGWDEGGKQRSKVKVEPPPSHADRHKDILSPELDLQKEIFAEI